MSIKIKRQENYHSIIPVTHYLLGSSELPYLVEGLQFWGTEPIAFFHPRVSFQEGPSGYPPCYPFQRNHVTISSNE